jgi:hypothetical protein
MITNKHKAYLLVTVTFILGAVVGASGQYLLSQQKASPKRDKNVIDMTLELDEKLHLDTVRKTQIQEILTDAQNQHENLKKQIRPQHEEIRMATRKRIRELLTDEQKKSYDEWTQEYDAKRAMKEAREKSK